MYHADPIGQGCTSPSLSTDRKTSRAALRFLSIFLSPPFLLCSCFAVPNVCVCVCVCVACMRASFKQLFLHLCHALSTNFACVRFANVPRGPGCRRHHQTSLPALSVLGLRECRLQDGSFLYLLHVANPWGLKGLWHGPWCYSSDMWDRHPEVEATLGRSVRGLSAALDGTFWMDVDSFFMYVEQVTIVQCCHFNYGLEPFYRLTFSQDWPCTGNPEPQLSLRSSKPTFVTAVLSQSAPQVDRPSLVFP